MPLEFDIYFHHKIYSYLYMVVETERSISAHIELASRFEDAKYPCVVFGVFADMLNGCHKIQPVTVFRPNRKMYASAIFSRFDANSRLDMISKPDDRLAYGFSDDTSKVTVFNKDIDNALSIFLLENHTRTASFRGKEIKALTVMGSAFIS